MSSLLSKEQSENLLFNLSSFYRDFLPVDNSLLKLYNIYAETIDYAWNVYREAEDAQFISTTRTLSTIPYFKVNVDDALYDIDTANVISNMSLEEQITYLDKEGKYSSFIFSRKEQTTDPVVYSMRLMLNFTDEEPLKMYQDYFVRNNKLYLLPTFIETKKQVYRHLHAFDMKINDYTLEKNFGTRFSLNPGPLLTRFEYRDVLESYIRAFQGNLTIKSIKDSIQLATKWEEFAVEDFKSPNISPTKLQLYKNFTISPLKFLLTLPESLIADKVKTNMVRTLLNEIKEVQTDYMVFYDILRNENVPIMMAKKPTVHYNRGEELTPDDTHDESLVTMSFQDDPFALSYDSSNYFNQDLPYDADQKREVASITHYTLMIPRDFSVTKSATVTFSVKSNQDTTTTFELYGATNSNGPYTLIESIENNKQATTISFLHNAMGSGKLYYKSRSKDPDRVSLYTLPIYIGT